MRITYRTLGKLIEKMSEQQKDSDVTTEVFDGAEVECFPAHLRICGETHDILGENHPVIFVDQVNGHTDYFRTDNIETICEKIGLN